MSGFELPDELRELEAALRDRRPTPATSEFRRATLAAVEGARAGERRWVYAAVAALALFTASVCSLGQGAWELHRNERARVDRSELARLGFDAREVARLESSERWAAVPLYAPPIGSLSSAELEGK